MPNRAPSEASEAIASSNAIEASEAIASHICKAESKAEKVRSNSSSNKGSYLHCFAIEAEQARL